MSIAGSQHVYGVVVPPSNPTVEPEMVALLAGAGFPYTARFPLQFGESLAVRLAGYRDDLSTTVGQFRGLGPEAVLVACTGSSYPLGPEGDAALASQLTEELGFPVVTAAGAVRQALEALAAHRLALVSPYPDWLTEQCVAFWTEAGFEVVAQAAVPGSGIIYDVTTGAVDRAVAEVAGAPVDVILVAGTGARTLETLDARAGRVPILSSNSCGAWMLARLTGAVSRLAARPALQALRALGDAASG